VVKLFVTAACEAGRNSLLILVTRLYLHQS